MSLWIALAVIVLTAALVARRWLPDRSTLSDTAYDAYRALVPAPRPTVRVVTKRIARICRRQRVVMPYGHKAVLPRAFLVGLAPEEYAVIEPLLDTVQEAVAASLLRTAREKQWLYAGSPQVVVQESQTCGEGRPEVIATTLPPPRSLSASPDTALPREATESLDATTDRADPAHPGPGRERSGPGRGPTGQDGTGPAPGAEATRAQGWSPPARPSLVAVPLHPAGIADPASAWSGHAPDLRPEPTAAETAPAPPEIRLRSTGGEPDIVVSARPVTVGRSPGCQVVLAYASASREHLRLVPSAGGCRVEDLGSRHGTRVNGALVRQPVLLRPRDTLQIGSMGPCWTYQPAGGNAGHVAPSMSVVPGPSKAVS